MHSKSWVILGCFSAAAAIVMGAFGAHGLEKWLQANHPNIADVRFQQWQTAANYHLIHSIGLILVGLGIVATGMQNQDSSER